MNEHRMLHGLEELLVSADSDIDENAESEKISYYSIDSARDDVICPICMDMLYDPVQTRECGHVFCRECINQWAIEEDKENCPLCQTELDAYQFQSAPTDLRVQREVMCTKVKCDLCRKEVEFQHWPEHPPVCPERHVPCPYKTYGCNKIISIKELEEHETIAVKEHLAMTVKQLGIIKEEKAEKQKVIGLEAKVARQTAKLGRLERQLNRMDGEIIKMAREKERTIQDHQRELDDMKGRLIDCELKAEKYLWTSIAKWFKKAWEFCDETISPILMYVVCLCGLLLYLLFLGSLLDLMLDKGFVHFMKTIFPGALCLMILLTMRI